MKRLFFLALALVSSLLLIQMQSCSSSDPAVVPAVATFPDVKSFFDAAYVAPFSSQDNAMTQDIVDGKPVLVLKDLIGDNHLTWVNDRASDKLSPMFTTPPVYHVDGTQGYILIPNVDRSRWVGKQFTKKPQPFDIYVVLRDLEAVSDEGYFAETFGLRDRSGSPRRLEVSLNDGANSRSVTTTASLEYNKISIVRLRYDGANTTLSINGVQASGALDMQNLGLNFIAYGTPSHIAQHDFFGMWIKFGKVSDADHAVVYKTLSDFYKPGTFPDKPIATSIRATWNNASKSWEAKYTYQGANPEDKTKTEFRWGFHDKTKDLNTAGFFAAGSPSTGASLVRANFANIFTQPGQNKVDVFVTVKVFDDKGNSWDHVLRSPPTPDNVP
jgi:hypothetical protein